ncbi:MAG: hypothetical protein MJ072_03985, partial [Clostridia bacterium]|nr:hypothetical protein [Clostridia bacterium]
MEEKEELTVIKNPEITGEDYNGEVIVEEEETYKEMSPIRLVMRRFFRSKLSIVGIIMIVFLFLFSYLGPVIYTKWQEDIPDTKQVVYENKTTYSYFDENNDEVTYEEIIYHTSNTNSYASPSSEHFLGTDDKGMDVFVRLMYGGRISLSIGFIVVILETVKIRKEFFDAVA